MTEDSPGRGPVRLLYVGMTYDYGQPERGYCYENVNFLDSLKRMPSLDVMHFPYDVILRSEGRKRMNDALLRIVGEFKPALCLFVLFTDEIAPATIRTISDAGGATTLNWFGDDHWRFLPYSRHWAPLFHWVITTDSDAVPLYRALGCSGVVKSQWGFNHHVITRNDLPEEFDVTFVGQNHSRRREIIASLRRSGVDVRCWGKGWEDGRLSQDQMIAMYARSRINLNFAESSTVAGWRPIAKTFVNRRADDTIQPKTPVQMFEHARALLTARRPQIKARNFEITGAGGFLLTSDADNLHEYFDPGKEIVIFSSVADLADQIRYFLSHPAERERIRSAGHLRALRDHSYEQRFSEIFATIGIRRGTSVGTAQ